MKTYKVIGLGNIKGECGWEVNDAHYTGREVELSENAQLPEIMAALKKADLLKKHITRRSLSLDDYNEGYSYFLRSSRTGEWLWELRPEWTPTGTT